MPIAEASVRTERASRYLIQLCEHLNRMGRQHRHRMLLHADVAPQVQRVEWSNVHGVITLDGGQSILEATTDTLTVRVEATDADSLRLIQTMVTRRLETIGRRDHLAIAW